MIRKMLVASAIAAAVGAVAVPSVSAADIFVRVGPPPARVETAPAPRHGYTWVPGYWDWRGHRHVWVGGHWVRERPGYVYYAPRWHERNGGWYMEHGHWGRGDRDHDGVANRYDRDRDGDGVPNRYDRRPDNPHRS